MADYEVLAPGGHAHLVSDVKSYADRAGGKGTTQLADGSVTRDKLADGVTDRIDAMRDRCDPLVGNHFFNDIAEGSVLTADDVYTAPPKGVEVSGKSTQVSTTGKNLLSDDMNDWPYTTISGANRPTLSIPVEDGVTYTYHRNLTGTLGIIAYWYNEATQESAYAGQASGWTNYATQTVTNSDGWTHLTFSCTGISSNTLHEREAQLEKGSAFTSYEPYSGGAASPRPDWPQPILSVDDLTLVLCGKNLFDPSHLLEASGWTVSDGVYTGWSSAIHTSFTNGYPLPPFVANTRYTLSFDFDYDGDDGIALAINFVYADGTQGGGYVTAKNSHQALTSSAGKTLSAIGFSYGANRVIRLSNIQVEQASTATAYEPYVGQSVEIPLSNHVGRSLPDGTRDTLTLSYVAPSTEHEGWGVFSKTLVQNVDTYVLPANIFETQTPTDIGDGWYRYVKYGVIANNATTTKGLCDRTDYYSSGVTKYEHIYLANAAVLFVTQLTTSTDASSALEGGTLQYHCTQQTHNLGTVELPILPNPLTAWADGGSAQPTISMSYEQDINIVIARLEDAIADLATA